jgi:hypothetical protein
MDRRQRVVLLGVAAVIAAVAIVIAISSGGDDEKSSSTDTTPAAAQTTAPDAGITDKTAQEPPPPAPEQIAVKGGEPDGGVKKIEVNKNDPLEIVVTSDAKVPIHFHGYDIEKDAAPGKPATFKLKKANIDGVFEMEVESTKTKIASITVKP